MFTQIIESKYATIRELKARVEPSLQDALSRTSPRKDSAKRWNLMPETSLG